MRTHKASSYQADIYAYAYICGIDLPDGGNRVVGGGDCWHSGKPQVNSPVKHFILHLGRHSSTFEASDRSLRIGRVRMDIGNQIRERRQRLGLSQEELAQRLYVTRVTVSHWETSKTLPDVQSMLLLANLFGTTIDELVRGDVDEMHEMVEKNERRTRTFALALATVEVVVVTALAVTAVAGRAYLEPVLRLLLAVLVLAFSVAVLVARRGQGDEDARSAAELLGASTGEPVEAARASGAALGMRVVLQVFAGLAVGIGVLVAADVLLDGQAFLTLAVSLAAGSALLGSFFLGLLSRPAWTAAILPVFWIMGAIALSAATGGLGLPRDWFAVAGGAVVLLGAPARRVRRGARRARG